MSSPQSKSYKPYVERVLRQVNPSLELSPKSTETLNIILHNVTSRLIDSMELLLGQKKTLDSREAQSATRLIIPGELMRHAVAEGTKALIKYKASLAEDAQSKLSGASRAGLVFEPFLFENALREGRRDDHRVSKTAPVYLAAVIEYLAAEILELAANSARDNGREKISNRDIFMVIQNDEELQKLFKNTVFSGVVPNIEAELLPKRSEEQ